MLPFQNNIIGLEMTGSQVASALAGDLVVAGIKVVRGQVMHPDGTALVMDSVYHVLTTDYLYSRADQPFSGFDSEPYSTSLVYAEPTVIYLQALGTTAEDPLDGYLDGEARR